MRVLRGPAVLSAATVLAVLLAGCSGSGDDDASGAPAEQTSPLSEYLSAVYGGDLSPDEQERQFAEQQAQTEELVAQCMQDEGFEYSPDTQSGGFTSGGDIEYEPEDRDWVAQWGYGAVNSPFNDPAQPTEEYVDPNGDYLATLSESEQAAFNEALYGPGPDEDEISEDGSFDYDWQTAGCQGAAQHQVSGDDPSQSEEFKPLFDAINALYEDTQSSPEMSDLDAEWAACMDAAGKTGFTTQADAQNSVYDDMNALYEEMPVSEDGSGELDPAATDALAEEEVELALVDLDCREETDYRDRSAEVTRVAEEQFISDHQAELDALVAASEQD